jgi:hypothetical protein
LIQISKGEGKERTEVMTLTLQIRSMKVSPLREYTRGPLYLPRATRFWRILLRKWVGVKMAKMRGASLY